METAQILFDGILKRDVVLWMAMIDGYGKSGDLKSARAFVMMASNSRVSDFKEELDLFSLMQEANKKPNESVLVSVLTACAHLGAPAQGLWVHSYVKRHHLDSNPILATALVDMYSKCGCVEPALLVFEGILNKDAGFVDVGFLLFEQMGAVFGVEPQLEHYACIVDLLGRAGGLEEAETFIEEKIGGFEGGDANVWGALLGACKIYGNVEVGNKVWKKLTQLHKSWYAIDGFINVIKIIFRHRHTKSISHFAIFFFFIVVTKRFFYF
ncbi:hypothetical protein NE237_027628 [Protea cynaroides]|uniref:Pentatricopeptide repeat-containing protein n=1 Tax=Protea cynaroides TaxID=273540 RepID=A0A9Q0GMW2_9MAGN|nr:hypothetical protein NE237_027628 [Protea cynaroides]